jgi:hypothetical protein
MFCKIGFAVFRWHNPRKTVTHVVLTILAGNMMLYLFYYVFRKNCIGKNGFW